jgi:hypothetical protein
MDAPSGVSLFALYDGHGGAEVARFSALHMVRPLSEGGGSSEQRNGGWAAGLPRCCRCAGIDGAGRGWLGRGFPDVGR